MYLQQKAFEYYVKKVISFIFSNIIRCWINVGSQKAEKCYFPNWRRNGVGPDLFRHGSKRQFT
ncbi:MAG: hypothetical protein BWY08_01024 [Bacteroidetes bacterium ADurb.Bin174]|nr:MAG: hypothetical protein BWY08_01024 [Bacteroidetes bacterium ADurb.Bin174]